MCWTECVFHLPCKHWGPDRFVGEPCVRARPVVSRQLSPVAGTSSRSSSVSVYSTVYDPSVHSTASTVSSTNGISSCSSVRSPSIDSASSTSSSTDAASSVFSATHARNSSVDSTTSISSSRTDAAAAEPSSDRTDSLGSGVVVCGHHMTAVSELGPIAKELVLWAATDATIVEKTVYLPCLYQEKIGCSNSDEDCPRCVKLAERRGRSEYRLVRDVRPWLEGYRMV
ncbi:hypothetical protein NA57DRAFT_58483 [Rhizodiscina lignyota]|uniref:Uncharacterized protein n=1 Tax=Rhizodiscina lignyota TaxID=1504668 RepID=A0A9P4M893_9PEZI|nr:hypothetical protein NA57DRAFT_58483 [Rhizodiscina lignyota]